MSQLIGIIGDTTMIRRGGPGGVDVQQIELHAAYGERIVRAGGTPVVLPNLGTRLIDQYCKTCSGFLFAGGFDHLQRMGDSCYGDGELMSPVAATLDQGDALRQLMEGPFIRAILRADKPFFGICRGMQALNVACGGTLYADIQLEVAVSRNLEHNDLIRRFERVHDVAIEQSSVLASIIGNARLGVNSRHHQAVRHIGAGLSISARADDNLIEAIEMPGKRFVVGVQWHPEDLDDEESDRIFEEFVEACAA